MVRLGIAALLVFAMFTAVQPKSSAAQDVDAEDLIRLFDAVALGGSGNEQGRVFKWRSDVSVRFTGVAAVRHVGWAEAQLDELGSLTGLTLSREDSIGADLLVVFVNTFDDVLEGRYNQLIDQFVAGEERRTALLDGFREAGAVCAGQVVATGNRLTSGIVFVPRDQLAPVVRSCISAQFARVMGLPFAASERTDSALAESSPHSHLTTLDRALLRLLYHPRMKAGLSRTDALTIARSVLPELLTSAQ